MKSTQLGVLIATNSHWDDRRAVGHSWQVLRSLHLLLFHLRVFGLVYWTGMRIRHTGSHWVNFIIARIRCFQCQCHHNELLVLPPSSFPTFLNLTINCINLFMSVLAMIPGSFLSTGFVFYRPSFMLSMSCWLIPPGWYDYWYVSSSPNMSFLVSTGVIGSWFLALGWPVPRYLLISSLAISGFTVLCWKGASSWIIRPGLDESDRSLSELPFSTRFSSCIGNGGIMNEADSILVDWVGTV